MQKSKGPNDKHRSQRLEHVNLMAFKNQFQTLVILTINNNKPGASRRVVLKITIKRAVHANSLKTSCCSTGTIAPLITLQTAAGRSIHGGDRRRCHWTNKATPLLWWWRRGSVHRSRQGRRQDKSRTRTKNGRSHQDLVVSSFQWGDAEDGVQGCGKCLVISQAFFNHLQ